LANSVSARKRARQAERHRMRNASMRSNVRTAIKKVLRAIEDGDKDAAANAYKEVVPTIDRSVAKGIMHKNTAARNKSRLNQHVKDM
jgi:small subunit ribosomal protein S20